MKFYYLALLIFPFLSIQTLAQPTLTIASQTPTIGDVYNVEFTEIASFQPGEGGANQVWDFSSSNLPTTLLTFSILAPEDAICANDFPDADFVWRLDAFEAYEFYEIESTGLSLIGGAAGSVGDILFKDIFSDKEDALQFPLTYQDNYTYTSTFTPILFGNPLAQDTRNGTVEADGYGTLITPDGVTHNNVLRIVITSMTQNIPIMETQYAWIQPGQFIPIMVYTSEDDPETVPSVYYTTGLISNTRDRLINQDLGIRLQTNPIQGQINLLGLTNHTEPLMLSIFNSQGQQLKSQPAQANVPVTDLPPGSYYLILTKEGARQVLPFVKMR